MTARGNGSRRALGWLVAVVSGVVLLFALVALAGHGLDDHGWGAVACGHDAGATSTVEALDAVTGAPGDACLIVRRASSGVDVLVVWQAPHQEVVQEQAPDVARAVWTQLPYTIDTITIVGIGEADQPPIVLDRAALTAANGDRPADLDTGTIAPWERGDVRVGLLVWSGLALVVAIIVGAVARLRRPRDLSSSPEQAVHAGQV